MGSAARNDRTSAAVLRQLLHYNPDTGVLTWRARSPEMFLACTKQSPSHTCGTWNTRFAGKVAGSNKQGYLAVRLPCGMAAAHRVIWAMMTGSWPEGEIDHDNRRRSDNRWSNLSCVDQIKNARNRSRQKNNTSGIVGVYLFRGQWRAQIGGGRQKKFLGGFGNLEDARAARKRAEKQFGYNPGHGAINDHHST